MNVQLKYLSFTQVPEAGLIFKIEKFWKTLIPFDKKKLTPNSLHSKFQFHWNLDSNTYVGEIYEGQNLIEASEIDIFKGLSSNRDILNSNDDRGTVLKSSLFSLTNREKETPKISTPRAAVFDLDPKNIIKSYADNIHTLRLVDNMICEIDEMKSEEREELEQLESKENESVFKQGDDKEEDEVDKKGFELRSIKTRKQFFDVVNQRDVPKVIKNLKWGGNLLVLCLIAIAFISHFISVMEFQQINSILNLKVLQDRQISELIYIVQGIQYLVLLNQGLFGKNTSSLENGYKSQINTSLTLIEEIQNTLQLNPDQLSETQTALLNNNVIKMYFNSTYYELFDLNQASQQIISKTFQVVNLNLSQFILNDPNIFFLVFNMFNDYFINLQLFSDYFIMNLFYVIDQKQTIFLILLILAVLLDFVAIVILIPLTLKVSNSKDKVLALFLDIPPGVLKKLCIKCENFLTNLQVGDEDDIESERSEEIMDDEFDREEDSDSEPAKVKKKKKRKKSKKSARGQKKFIFILVASVLVFEIYFGMNYFFSETLIQGLVPLIQEANDTSKAEPTFSLYHTILRYFL